MSGTPTFLGAGISGGATHNTASANRFFMLSTCNLIFTATEANVHLKTRAAGGFSRLGARVSTNGRTTSSTLKLRKGGADGNNSASIAASTTGWFEDATPHTDTVADGDLLCGAVLTGSGTGNLTLNGVIVKFVADSGAAGYLGWYAAGDSAGIVSLRVGTASTNYSLPLSGGSHNTAGYQTSESATFRVKLRSAGTMSYIQIIIITNGRSTASTLKFRKGGADGNGAASIASSTTGLFEDASNTDSVAAADVCNWMVSLGTGTGNLDVDAIAGKMTYGGTAFDIANADTNSADGSGSTSANNYYGLFGRQKRQTSESAVQTAMPYAVTSSYLRCYVQQGNSGALTLALRKGGSSVNQSLSIGSGATGLFEDTSNTDALADGDQINYMHGAMASTFAFNIQWIALTLDPGGGGGGGGGGSSRTRRFNTVILGG